MQDYKHRALLGFNDLHCDPLYELYLQEDLTNHISVQILNAILCRDIIYACIQSEYYFFLCFICIYHYIICSGYTCVEHAANIDYYYISVMLFSIWLRFSVETMCSAYLWMIRLTQFPFLK